MLPEKGVSIGGVWITQLDWKRVPQVRSRGCKVLSPKLAVVMTWHLLTAAVCGGFVAGCPPRAGRFRLVVVTG